MEFWAIKPTLEINCFKTIKHVKWIKPSAGIFKINTDGASFGNPGMAAAAGVCRDSNGNWIKGFCRNFGIATSLFAEIVAIRDAIQMAIDLRLPNVQFETDSSAAISLINKQDISIHHYLLPLVMECRFLLMILPQTTLTHWLREGNKLADALAGLAFSQAHRISFFDSPPLSCSAFCTMDDEGICFPRLCV